MKSIFRKKSKRELAKVSCYVYRGTEIGYYIYIRSDVQIYEDQLSKIYDIIRREFKSSHPNIIAERIVTEVGNPISKASFEYDEKTKNIQIELGEWPWD